MESRDTYNTTDLDQLTPDHPDLAAHPNPVDHERHIGGTSDDDLAIHDELHPPTFPPPPPHQPQER